MNLVTVDFVERVLYHKTQSLILKGSPFLTPPIKELVEYRAMCIGLEIVDGIVYMQSIEEKLQQVRNVIEKLDLLAAMDGGLDQPIGPEAIEIMSRLRL